MIRSLLAALLCAAASAQPQAPAAPAKPGTFPGDPVEISVRDGWKLKAKYSAPQEGKPSFLLLHGTGGRKEDWYRLVRPLIKRGYGVLALDLRGHGESRTAPDGSPAIWRKFVVSKNYNEYLNMSGDVEAGIAYLISQGIPEEKIGLVGADLGSSLALRYAALHPKVPLVCLLSPRMQYQEVTSVNAMRAYKERPVLMMYSDADKSTASGMPILQSFAKMSVGEQRLTVIAAPTEHGAKMLRGPVIGQLLDWLENPIKPEVSASSGTAISSGSAAGVRSSSDTFDEDDSAAPAPVVQ